ncbi:MAG: acetate kinase [Bacteroidales bacterium]|nr:acetate kinase [Bacteroidales bacterium]
MIVLVINCGSSSIKYRLMDIKSDDVYDILAKGIVEKIGLPEGISTYSPAGKESRTVYLPVPNHTVGMKLILDDLVDKDHGVLKTFDDIEAVGHRVVQGADYFTGSALVNDDVLKKIEICAEFAPLHNRAHLLGIRACQAVLPSVPEVVVFDTAFHQTMPDYAYIYALPYEYYTKYHVRRYGAHGTSHDYVSHEGARFAGIDIGHSKIVTCHIGSGSSVCAVLNGKCIDTSMGFTPLEGMIMGTRCGCIDANIVPYIMKKENLTPDDMTDLMNKKSGFMGLSGRTSDAREMDELANSGDYRAKLVLKKLTYDIVKLIGSYVAAMDGIDLLVFTAGIGEHNSRLRRRVCENLTYLGIKVDYEANMASGTEAMISTPDSKVKVALIPTEEELMIARDTMRIVSALDE